ncbi:MAG: HEAT repeat domain-containing protein [Micropepsaceae bacterium]
MLPETSREDGANKEWLVGFNLFARTLAAPFSWSFAGLFHNRRKRAQARVKRKFAEALLLAGNGKRAPYLVRRLSAFEHRLLLVAAIELLRVMRGAPAARIVRLLARYHARETLGAWMQHQNAVLRAFAAEGLGHMGDSQGCLMLGRALHDEDHHVRMAAAESLIKLGVAPPQDELVAALEVNGEPPARLWRMLDLMRANHPDPARRGADELQLDEAAAIA